MPRGELNSKDRDVFAAIQQHFAVRYPGDFHRTVVVREFLERACRRHLDLGLGDADLSQKLCFANDHQYWQQLSEILLGHELMDAGLALIPSRDGPDFLFEHEGGNIWVEAICPQPEGIPSEWLAQPTGKAYSLPHEAILLRWTAAIKEKAQKLLGNAASGAKGYIEKKVVPRATCTSLLSMRACFAGHTLRRSQGSANFPSQRKRCSLSVHMQSPSTATH